jgi:integrase
MARKFLKLTPGAIKKLKAPGAIREGGIVFKRKANGDGAFYADTMVDGQRIHRCIASESDGRAWAEGVLESLRSRAREHRLGLAKGRKLAMGFAEAAGKYIERLGLEGGKDLTAKRRRIEMHLAPFFKTLPLNEIDNAAIERYKVHRLDQIAVRGGPKSMPANPEKLGTTKPGTVNRELAALSHLLHKAVEWGWIGSLPTRIKLLPDEARRINYLSVESCAAVLACAKNDENPQIHAFILIGLQTSMRLSEILGMRRENVDLAGRTIFIPKAKAGARKQPITSELVEFLRGYIAALPPDTPWLFPSATSASGHTTDVRKAFRRVIKAAGLNPDEVVRHTLRHTAITHMVQALVNLPTVKLFSGHKTLAMVERYAHASTPHVQGALDKLEARYRKTG